MYEMDKIDVNVLVVGNGFDLCHGLPTRYSDFLQFMAEIIDANSLYPGGRNGYSSTEDYREDDQNAISEFLRNYRNRVVNEIIKKDENEIRAFLESKKELIRNNNWLRYFFYVFIGKAPGDDGNRWIDFESEMANCLELVFEGLNESGLREPLVVFYKQFYVEEHRYVKKAFRFVPTKRMLSEENWDIENVRNVFYAELHSQLLEVAEWLNFYLKLVESWHQERPLIDRLTLPYFQKNIDALISFNYTNTGKDYFADSTDAVFYINGSLEKNIILGIENEPSRYENKDIWEYIHCFFKNEQRVINGYYYDYESLFSYIKAEKAFGKVTIHFVGHSLDINDRFVLLSLINNCAVKNVVIYYYQPKEDSERDKRDKVKKLHELLGEEMFNKCVNNLDGKPVIELKPLELLQSTVINKISP